MWDRKERLSLVKTKHLMMIKPLVNGRVDPWQKENLKYLQEKGNQPAWSSPAPEETEDTSKDHEDEQEETFFEADEAMEESVDEKEALPEPENKARSFADRLPNLKAYRNRVDSPFSLDYWIVDDSFIDCFVFSFPPLSRLANGRQRNHEVSAEAPRKFDLTVNEEMWPQFSNVIKACLPSKRIATYKNASISIWYQSLRYHCH